MTSRRDFLKLSAAGGAIVATSSLPAWAGAKADVFAGRGSFERLSLGYAVVKAGATKSFSVLHISDTHLTAAYDREGPGKLSAAARRTQTFGGRQEEALRDSLAWAKTNVDYVVHTGDLIDFQSEANFDLVKKHFGGQMFGSMGNHEFYTYLPDEKVASEESFKSRSWPLLAKAYPIDARFSSTVVNGINFVCLDDTFGTVQSDLVAKFKTEAAKGLPIVLCMHVPFFTDAIRMAHSKFWHFPTPDGQRQQSDATTRDFIAYLRGEPLLKAILAGHEHVSVQERFSPTAMQYVVGGSFLFHGREILFT